MSEPDVVLDGLSRLTPEIPSAELTQKVRAAGHARLRPAKVHPAVSWTVAASVLVYLGWALLYTGQI